MDKLSLYNLLSVLLPGALLSFIIKLLLESHGFILNSLENQAFFSVFIYSSTSLFLGSLINILAIVCEKFLTRIGLHDSIEKIAQNYQTTTAIKAFIDQELKKTEEETEYNQYESLWSEMYYNLEANDKISIPKDFQSFYFFFRNFFMLGLIVLTLLVLQMVIIGISTFYITLFITCIVVSLLSIIAGRWYRKKMVERLFWTYYSLYKNN